MTLDEFSATLNERVPPPVSMPLQALWHAANENWDEAHRIAHDVKEPTGAWVHAYLHRQEGDLGNARYWYQRARQPEATDSLEAEWARIVAALLELWGLRAQGSGLRAQKIGQRRWRGVRLSPERLSSLFREGFRPVSAVGNRRGLPEPRADFKSVFVGARDQLGIHMRLLDQTRKKKQAGRKARLYFVLEF